MRRAAKRDANEQAIVDALRAAGASVEHLSGCGVPDLLVGFRGRVVLAEVKDAKGELTPYQVEWHTTWRGPQPVILRSVEDALALLRT